MKKEINMFELDKLVDELKKLYTIKVALEDKKDHYLDKSNLPSPLIIPERLLKKLKASTEESIEEVKNKISQL